MKCKFFTPNGVHAVRIDQNISDLMFDNGFTGLKIGVESVSNEFHNKMDHKLSPEVFVNAVNVLRKTGFDTSDIGAYVMVGLPKQQYEDIKNSIDFVVDSGAKPYITQYSPVPQPHGCVTVRSCLATTPTRGLSIQIVFINQNYIR